MHFAVQPVRPFVPQPVPSFHHWLLPDGTLWLQFYRTPAGYLLRFTDLAEFEISADGQTIACWPSAEISDGTIQHLYLNQVLPLALSQQGKLVFHASAVQIGAGAVAFMGPSGRGKSTAILS
jgi:ABC-type multidrug transport system fused ATPase/permease subunit